MMTTTKWVAAIAAMLLVAGCASKAKVPDGGSYVKRVLPDKTVVEEYRTPYAIQADDVKDARASQKPIMEMEALDGQTIELRGVKRFAVYAPSGGATPASALLNAPTRAPDTFDRVLAVTDRVLDRTLQAVGLRYSRDLGMQQARSNEAVQLGAQRMTVDVVSAVGASNSQIAGNIQAPGPTYNLGGGFMTLGDNSPLTHSSNNPVTRTCTGAPGASSGAGGSSTSGAGAPSGAGGAGGSASC